MTTAQVLSEREQKELDKQAREARAKELTEKETKANTGRSGVGLRVHYGYTRGKGSKEINWEAFDTDKPETLPKTQKEFMELTSTTTEPVLVGYLIDGYNSSQYAAASDVLAEFVEPNWDSDFAKKFKAAVSAYAANTGTSIEETVSIMKPPMQKAFDARLAAKK